MYLAILTAHKTYRTYNIFDLHSNLCNKWSTYVGDLLYCICLNIKWPPPPWHNLCIHENTHTKALELYVWFKMPPHFSYRVLGQKFSSNFEVNMASKSYSNYPFNKQTQCRMLCKWCTVLPKISTTLLFPYIFQISTGNILPYIKLSQNSNKIFSG
jgi:hypothetical protein